MLFVQAVFLFYLETFWDWRRCFTSSGWFLLEPRVFVLQSFLLDPNLPVREEAAQDCGLPRQKQWKVGQNNKRAKNNTIHRFYSRFYDAGKSVVGDPDLGQILASLIGVVGYMSEIIKKKSASLKNSI